MKREISSSEIIPMDRYRQERSERRRRIAELKRDRRLGVGPYASFYFESYDTMLHQVHEMLFIEQGGDAQLESELEAYNPLIPKGSNLVATVMFEIENPQLRTRELSRLGGVEEQIHLEFGFRRVNGVAIGDGERTRADGKTSAVHFLSFDLTPEAVEDFKLGNVEVKLAISHPNYGHAAVMPERVRSALRTDLR